MDPTLIGRENEVAALRQALHPGAVVTLVGPPGVGKSSVARWVLRWAHRDLPAARNLPIEVVDLDSARTIGEVAARLARARREPPPASADEDAVAFQLSRRPSLLLFDEADDAIEALGSLLLRWTPGFACVVTSCRRLGLAHEVVQRIAPFSAPVDGEESDASQLLLAELQRRGAPALGPDVAARLVRPLEGLPLAIVRGAAMVSVTGAEGLEGLDARELEDFASDERGHRARHRTLRAAFDAQWAELEPDLRAFACGVAVFESPFSARSAAAVAVDPLGEVVSLTACVERLGRLAERSVLLSEADGPAIRFRFLGAMRRRALDELARSAGRDAIWARLVEHFAEDVDASNALSSPRRPERATARQAFAHALERRAFDPAARILVGLAPGYLADGPLDELVRMLRAFPLDELSSGRAAALALLTGLGLLFTGQREASFGPFEQASRLADGPDRALSLSYLGLVRGLSGEFEVARAHLADARAAVDAAHSPLMEARVLKNIANVLAEEGHEGALEVMTRAIECFKRGGDVRGEGFMTLMRGSFLLDQNRLPAARAGVLASLELLGRSDRRSMAWAECILATIDRDEGKLELAREGYRRSEEGIRAIGDRQTLGIVLQLWTALELELRSPRRAIELGAEAELLLEAAHDLEHLAMVRALLGAAWAMDGQVEAARGHFERARATLPPRGRRARRSAVDVLALAVADPAERARVLAARSIGGPGPVGAASVGESEEERVALRILGKLGRKASERPQALVLHVAHDGSWAVVAGGPRIDLARKPILRNLLELLVRRREQSPGEPVSTAQLLRKAWPNERSNRDAALNRLYVALTRLRAMGLDEVIERDPKGYWIRPTVSIERGKPERS